MGDKVIKKLAFRAVLAVMLLALMTVRVIDVGGTNSTGFLLADPLTVQLQDIDSGLTSNSSASGY